MTMIRPFLFNAQETSIFISCQIVFNTLIGWYSQTFLRTSFGNTFGTKVTLVLPYRKDD